MAEEQKPPVRKMPPKAKSNFLTRTATDDASQLERRFSAMPQAPEQNKSRRSGLSSNPRSEALKSLPHRRSFDRKPLDSLDGFSDSPTSGRRSFSSRKPSQSLPRTSSSGFQTYENGDFKDRTGPRIGALPRPVGGFAKLGTFSGVFVPTTLNVLSILMFLRFGFILGQSGVVGMMGMLVVSYMISLVTTLSVSAIATNGTVRGGGAYYLISRSLGPEFGGSLGVIYYLGGCFNSSLNSVGLIDCLKQNFGGTSGNWSRWLSEGFWIEYLWATIVLVLCTAICLAGSGIFARCSNGLLAILLVATFSIPFSSFLMSPYKDSTSGTEFTGLSGRTFVENLLPKFTRGAAGSQLHRRENFQDLFGILFPATGGIFAGASMSGDLKHPSKAIPKGTLSGLGLTFFAYTVVIFAMAASITRASLYANVNVIQDTNLSGILILSGEFATSFFSCLMGVIGSAKLLQALARDHLLPLISIFGQGTKANDEPTFAIIFTFFVAQFTMLCDINQIASFVTMTYLMTFLVTNLACFLLKISSAPNFRPSFHYFNWWTAAFGTLISGASMFFVDGLYASGCVGILIFIFLIIHYTSPPKSWGDVSQSLIYHQVRKYLLRLRQEHVKFWRPQILLFINDPRRQFKLIQFCNSLKKGALFVLGHVIVSTDFGTAVPEARRQQAAWLNYIDLAKVKAFVNVAISPSVEWGTRNIVLNAGLGGMRPNITVLGFFDMEKYRRSQPLIDVPSPASSRPVSQATNNPKNDLKRLRHRDSKTEKLRGTLPTDNCRTESDISPPNYVTILEDLLLGLQMNVAIAKGFSDLEFPRPKGENTKKYIDLWPIQMSAEIAAEGDEEKQHVLTTNFNTYTLILQLGCILNTVPAWKTAYKLRVAVFVEYESELEEERYRVKTLLDNLRIEAEILVFWLASGHVKTYQAIINGDYRKARSNIENMVEEVLKDEEWWQNVQKLRGNRVESSAQKGLGDVHGLLNAVPIWPSSSFRYSRHESNTERFADLKKLLKSRRRGLSSNVNSMGVRMSMTTHRLHDDLVHRHASHASASEDSGSEDNEDEFSRYEEAFSASSEESENAAGELEEDIDNAAIGFRRPSKSKRRRNNTNTTRMMPPGKTPDTSKYLHDPFACDIPYIKRSDSRSDASTIDPTETPEMHRSAASSLKSRPRTKLPSSAGKLTADPVPETMVSPENIPGPSIMFSQPPSTPERPSHDSIYKRQSSANLGPSSSPPDPNSASQLATGFPSPSSIPLSFNDLPCRAQHLILNELILQHSADTAVLFTTLPAPVEGTCKSEKDSVRYLADLEVLCQGMPPVVLVHSNSLTVTVNL